MWAFSRKIILSLYGIDPFTIGANNLVEILTKENNGALDDSEADFSYSFLNISVGIWRQFSDSNVSESIEEMKANGEYEANKKWLEEDLAKSINFWTIGIGVKAYYKSV